MPPSCWCVRYIIVLQPKQSIDVDLIEIAISGCMHFFGIEIALGFECANAFFIRLLTHCMSSTTFRRHFKRSHIRTCFWHPFKLPAVVIVSWLYFMSKRYVPRLGKLQPSKNASSAWGLWPTQKKEQNQTRFETTRSWTMNTIHTDRVMNVIQN